MSMYLSFAWECSLVVCRLPLSFLFLCHSERSEESHCPSSEILQDLSRRSPERNDMPHVPLLCHTAFCITFKVSWPSLTSMLTVSPSCTLPSRMARATRFCTSRWRSEERS